ncbi:MAG: 50S ribosomal protein L29 [bacterium]
MKIKEEIKDLNSMDIKKLSIELKENQKKLMHNSLKSAAGKLENYSVIKKSRRHIARIITVIKEKMES